MWTVQSLLGLFGVGAGGGGLAGLGKLIVGGFDIKGSNNIPSSNVNNSDNQLPSVNANRNINTGGFTL